MKYRFTLIAAIFLVIAGSLVAQRQIDAPIKSQAFPRWQCGRIVSMAPSLTETLYALGLGDRVVGVSRDCHYPAEVENVQKTGNVGGYYDPNLEAIVVLKPDLVIMLEEQAQALPNFEKLGLETLVVNQQTIKGVIESFRVIGGKCGRGPEGRRMAHDLQERVDRICRQTQNLPRPRVLFVLDRIRGCGHLADLYVAADDSYIDTMIDWAGGKNAYSRRGVRYPVVSTEGIMSLNPDVIVDLVPPGVAQQLGRQRLLDDWNDAKGVTAVKNGRVLIFAQDYAYVPGPRFIRLVEDLARQLHPDVDWSDAQPQH
ncbi:MAG: helical backbone metal receptor [Thermoguttaceae bacterium]